MIDALACLFDELREAVTSNAMLDDRTTSLSLIFPHEDTVLDCGCDLVNDPNASRLLLVLLKIECVECNFVCLCLRQFASSHL